MRSVKGFNLKSKRVPTRRQFIRTLMTGCACSLPAASALGQLVPVDDYFQVRPTHLFKQEGRDLRQILLIDTPKTAENLTVEVQIGKRTEKVGNLTKIGNSYYLPMTPVEQEQVAQIRLNSAGRVVERSVSVRPVRQWKVFLHHTSQQTPGFIDLPSKVRASFVPTIDQAMEFCQQTDDWPEDAKFKWNMLASFIAEDYRKARGEAKMKELMDWVRKGRIGIGPGYSIMLADLMHLETLHRSIYYTTNRLSREFNVNFEAMILNDVPGFPWGFAGVMSKAGLRYMVFGANPYRSNIDSAPVLFYMVGPDESEVLVCRSAYADGIDLIPWKVPYPPYATREGIDVHGGEPAIAPIFERYDNMGYPFDAILLQVAFDYTPPYKQLSEFVRTWNSLWAYPKLHVSTGPEFFHYVETRYRDRIPRVRGGVPSSWVDLRTPEAHSNSLQRETEDRLPDAERLATLAQLVAHGPARQDEMSEAYNKLCLWNDEVYEWAPLNGEKRADIYVDESEGGGKQHWEEKLAYLQAAHSTAEQVESQSIKALNSAVIKRQAPSIVVWNPLSWTRSEIARVPSASVMQGPFRLIDDETGKEIPYQIGKYRDSADGVVFLAQDVPPLGYRIYLLDQGTPTVNKSAFMFMQGGLENQFYKLELSGKNGNVVSVFDKQSKQEFVDSKASHGFNELVYRLDKQLSNRMTANLGEIAGIPDFGSEASMFKGEAGPVYSSLKVRGAIEDVLGFEHEIFLFSQLKRVEFHNRIQKKPVYAKESVFYAFPFLIRGTGPGQFSEFLSRRNLRNPFRLDTPGAVMEPDADQVQGSTRDNYAAQHWVSIGTGDSGVIWSSADAPIVQLSGIHMEEYLEWLAPSPDSVKTWLYSHLMSNHWGFDIPYAQGGDYVFRYAMTTHGQDWTYNDAHHFGWGFMSPLRAFVIEGGAGGGASAPSHSFVEINPENIYVVTFKSAEDGNGTILRLYEGAGLQTNALVKFNLPERQISAAWLCDGREQNVSQLPNDGNSLKVPLKSFGVSTLRLVFR